MAETRTHFGACVIVSSPLTLSHDVNIDAISDEIWPVIANKEAIAINQAYIGYSGGAFQQSSTLLELDRIILPAVERGMGEAEALATGPIVSSSQQYLYKPLAWDGTETAVLLINSEADAQELTLKLSGVPGMTGPCDVRDIGEHVAHGNVAKSISATGESHDGLRCGSMT